MVYLTHQLMIMTPTIPNPEIRHYFVSESHEWDEDKSLTEYAEALGVPIRVFFVKNKKTAEYRRAILDNLTNRVLFDTHLFKGIIEEINRMADQKTENPDVQ